MRPLVDPELAVTKIVQNGAADKVQYTDDTFTVIDWIRGQIVLPVLWRSQLRDVRFVLKKEEQETYLAYSKDGAEWNIGLVQNEKREAVRAWIADANKKVRESRWKYPEDYPPGHQPF